MSSQANSELAKKDQEIARLQNHVTTLSNQLESAMQQQRQLRQRYPQSFNDDNSSSTRSIGSDNGNGNGNKRPSKTKTKMSPHAVHINIQQNKASRNGNSVIRTGRERMGRNASFYTQQVMASLPSSEEEKHANHPIVVRIMDMFQRPSEHIDYLRDKLFASDLFKLCQKVRQILEKEPRVIYLQSPCYIFGDIHGNLEDLHFFSDNIWRLGMSLTAGNFLFLGDYVDRGMNCLEVIAYLFAMKLQNPHKVFLLRGNHETRDVNGWEEHYGERAFISQCQERFDRFGGDTGYRVWEACNQVFDRLPLVAVVDQDIFCVHGGIPRPIPVAMANNETEDTTTTTTTTRIQDILNVPKVAGINPPYEHEDDTYQQIASDCIWSDPASEEQEQTSVDPNTGFGESLRGGGAVCFGNKAVTDFLQEQGFSYIMRAHEAHAEGVAVSKGARVFTVFSTSKDHHQGSKALAGCILVDDERLQVINRSPAYKNQYVHKRNSLSLAALSHLEIAKRIKLGLVTSDGEEDDDDDDDDHPYEHDHHDHHNEDHHYHHDDDDDTDHYEDEDYADDESEHWHDQHRSSLVSRESTVYHYHNDRWSDSSAEYDYEGMDSLSSLQFSHQPSPSSKKRHSFADNRRSSIDLTQIKISSNFHDMHNSSMDLGGAHYTSASSRHIGGASMGLQNETILETANEEAESDEDSTVNGDDVSMEK